MTAGVSEYIVVGIATNTNDIVKVLDTAFVSWFNHIAVYCVVLVQRGICGISYITTKSVHTSGLGIVHVDE